MGTGKRNNILRNVTDNIGSYSSIGYTSLGTKCCGLPVPVGLKERVPTPLPRSVRTVICNGKSAV